MNWTIKYCHVNHDTMTLSGIMHFNGGQTCKTKDSQEKQFAKITRNAYYNFMSAKMIVDYLGCNQSSGNDSSSNQETKEKLTTL